MTNCTISKKIKDKNSQNKLAMIPFIVAGDPDLETSKEIILGLQEIGADIIELGIPYSDPLADGPVIQKSAKRSLDAGATLANIISMHNSIKDKLNIPTVIFTYFNPVLAYGLEKFMTDVKNAGFKGVLVPDLPVEEAHEIIKLSKENNLEFVMLVTPTSGDERIKQITEASEGFVYLVSVTGVTGERTNFSDAVENSLSAIKRFTNKSICVGFGISKVEHIKQLKQLGANGAIVGSAIIKVIENNIDNRNNLIGEVQRFVKELITEC